MAIADVITGGYGSWGSIADIVLDGFSIGEPPGLWVGIQSASGTWSAQQDSSGTWNNQQDASSTWKEQNET